jgi:hypothetical protein
MTGKEMFLVTIEHRTVDRPAWWLGDPLPESVADLCFPTGLIFSPSHEALLPDVPPTNLEAFRQATSVNQEELNKQGENTP